MTGPYSLIIAYLGLSSINAEELLTGTLIAEGNTREEISRSIPEPQKLFGVAAVKGREIARGSEQHVDPDKNIEVGNLVKTFERKPNDDGINMALGKSLNTHTPVEKVKGNILDEDVKSARYVANPTMVLAKLMALGRGDVERVKGKIVAGDSGELDVITLKDGKIQNNRRGFICMAKMTIAWGTCKASCDAIQTTGAVTCINCIKKRLSKNCILDLCQKYGSMPFLKPIKEQICENANIDKGTAKNILNIFRKIRGGKSSSSGKACATDDVCPAGATCTLGSCVLGKSNCFSGDSMVTLGNGDRQRMSDLQVGDSVLTVDENNLLVFSPIILQLHRSPQENGKFLILRTNTGHSLPLTPQHLVYRKKQYGAGNTMNLSSNIKSFGAVFASDVKKGDFILVHDINKGLKPGQVVDVEEAVLRGIYSPLTSQGNIVVDDVLASCYSDFESHELQHLAFSPFRWLYRLLEFLPLTNLKLTAADQSTKQGDAGVYWYGQGLHVLADTLFPWKLWEGIF